MRRSGVASGQVDGRGDAGRDLACLVEPALALPRLRQRQRNETIGVVGRVARAERTADGRRERRARPLGQRESAAVLELDQQAIDGEAVDECRNGARPRRRMRKACPAKATLGRRQRARRTRGVNPWQRAGRRPRTRDGRARRRRRARTVAAARHARRARVNRRTRERRDGASSRATPQSNDPAAAFDKGIHSPGLESRHPPGFDSERYATSSSRCHPPKARSPSRGHRSAERAPRWTVAAVEALFALPFSDLLFRAQQVHREHHAPNAVQLSTLLSIKTGGCPEDCAYCPQAKRYHTGVADEPLAGLDDGARGRARGEGARRDALLHGRRLARAEGARPRAGARDGARREGARARDLLHARDAQGRPGRGAARRRARLLQPQPRHGAGVLRRRDHDARLRRSPRDARARARRRPPRVLRRHRRNGRVARRSARA